MPKIYNRRNGDIPPGAVYVGRPTKWGNPFTHIPLQATAAKYQVETRADAIEAYRQWISRAGQFTMRIEAIQELRGKDLVCWCAPEPCHAEILMEIANAGV